MTARVDETHTNARLTLDEARELLDLALRDRDKSGNEIPEGKRFLDIRLALANIGSCAILEQTRQLYLWRLVLQSVILVRGNSQIRKRI